MVPFTKPFLSVADQVDTLKQRGMAFGDENKAQRCLSRIGYYRLSAYWYPFREQLDDGTISDDFKVETSFEEVFDFYVFDKALRLLVSDGLERIEIALRAHISDQIGPRDSWAHRKPAELDGKFTTQMSSRNQNLTRHADWLRGQDRNFSRSKEDFAEHFKKRYQWHPPIWIAKEVWDWGMLSHFYSGMKYADRNAIASIYGNIEGKQKITWVRALNDVRNFCAHHSRLWNRGLPVTLKMPRTGAVPQLDHIIGDTHGLSRIYGVLVVMALIMKRIHPNTGWHRRVVHLAADAPRRPLIGVQSAGFPPNWEEQDIWYP